MKEGLQRRRPYAGALGGKLDLATKNGKVRDSVRFWHPPGFGIFGENSWERRGSGLWAFELFTATRGQYESR